MSGCLQQVKLMENYETVTPENDRTSALQLWKLSLVCRMGSLLWEGGRWQDVLAQGGSTVSEIAILH